MINTGQFDTWIMWVKHHPEFDVQLGLTLLVGKDCLHYRSNLCPDTPSRPLNSSVFS